MKRFLYLVIVISWIGNCSLFAQNLDTRSYSTTLGSLNTRFSKDDIAEMKTLGIDPMDDGQWDGIGSDNVPNYKTSACPASYTLATPYNTNNGQRGAMFDITATNTVTIRCFESSLYSGTTANYEIWYRPSTFVSFENSSTGWTLLGSATGVTSAGNNLPTPLPIPVNVTIPAGARYAFYITNDFGGGTSYTDGAAVGNFLSGNADMTVYEGVGKSYPFGLTFTVRKWNGTIFYDAGVVLDATTANISAEVIDNQTQISWNIESEHSYSNAEIQWSSDLVEFSTLQDLDANQESGVFQEPRRDTDSWYRLQLTDETGVQYFTNVEWVGKMTASTLGEVSLFPNPTEGNAQIHLAHESLLPLEIKISDGQGRKMIAKSFPEGLRDITIPMGELPAGLYFLEISDGENTVQKKLIRN